MKKLIFVILIFFTSSIYAESLDHYFGSWLCIEEESAGLDWENNQWNSVDWVLEKYIFKVTQDESLCKISKEGENQLCTSLTEFGNNTPLYLYYTYVNSASGSFIFWKTFKTL